MNSFIYAVERGCVAEGINGSKYIGCVTATSLSDVLATLPPSNVILNSEFFFALVVKTFNLCKNTRTKRIKLIFVNKTTLSVFFFKKRAVQSR